jgi:hypothetical protein
MVQLRRAKVNVRSHRLHAHFDTALTICKRRGEENAANGSFVLYLPQLGWPKRMFACVLHVPAFLPTMCLPNRAPCCYSDSQLPGHLMHRSVFFTGFFYFWLPAHKAVE